MSYLKNSRFWLWGLVVFLATLVDLALGNPIPIGLLVGLLVAIRIFLWSPFWKQRGGGGWD